jgi:RNA polymerase sigma-70 factor (ECF subfamily)
LLLALERMRPAERTAFLLHDDFDMPYTDIAPVLGKTEAARRQLVSRARRLVRQKTPAAPTDRQSHRRLLRPVFEAAAISDAQRLRAFSAWTPWRSSKARRAAGGHFPISPSWERKAY